MINKQGKIINPKSNNDCFLMFFIIFFDAYKNSSAMPVNWSTIVLNLKF